VNKNNFLQDHQQLASIYLTSNRQSLPSTGAFGNTTSMTFVVLRFLGEAEMSLPDPVLVRLRSPAASSGMA
jgi:hypothetical protein